jgi:hypothetical protein
MNFFKQLGDYMMLGARCQAQWELEMSNRIFGDRRRLFVLLLLMLPIVIGGIALADDLPDMLGGKSTYSPAFYSTTIFLASIGIGLMSKPCWKTVMSPLNFGTLFWPVLQAIPCSWKNSRKRWWKMAKLEIKRGSSKSG